MLLDHGIGIVALGERLQRLLDEGGVALIEQAAVPIAGIDDGPLVGVFKFRVTEPHEAVEPLPVASGLVSRFFEVESAEHSDTLRWSVSCFRPLGYNDAISGFLPSPDVPHGACMTPD